MRVSLILLIEPVSQHTPSRPQPANLNSFGAPALLAVEDRESRPSDLALGRLPYGASFRISFSFLHF